MTFTEIQNRVFFLARTDANSYPIADLTRSANNALERVVTLIHKSDNRWKFDDSNQTDLPIATAALTANQQDYSFPTTYLTIDRVEILDSTGNWQLLEPITDELLTRDQSQALSAYQSTPGTPTQYRKEGNSVFLYPAPNYTSSAGLKIYYSRAPVAFLTTDTTASPGFASIFHDLIPLWAAYDYALAAGLQTAQGFFSAIQMKEAELQDFYAHRDRDYRPRFTISTDSNK